MKIIFIKFLLVLMLQPIFADEIMRNFRSFSDVLSYKELVFTGVAEHSLSGSGQFLPSNIQNLAKVAQGSEIIVVDLRLESHGYINDHPFSLKNNDNLGKTAEEILEIEANLLQEVYLKQDKEFYPIYTVSSEKELVISNNFKYVRLPVLDHSHPSDEIVDAYLDLLKQNPFAWVHVHCAVGRGRTTTFMAMFDMFYNAKTVSLDDILERQKKIGGQDFKKYLKEPNKDDEKQQLFLARLAFLERFYQYCQAGDPETTTWQEWVNLQS